MSAAPHPEGGAGPTDAHHGDAPPSKAFSFPLLPDAELCARLAPLGVSISAAALDKPTPEFARAAFETLLAALVGVSRDDLRSLDPSSAPALGPHPELYEEAAPWATMLAELTSLMAAAGVEHFSLADVARPDPARLRSHLAALVNFAMFREEAIEGYDALAAGAAAAAEAAAGLEAERLALERALDGARAARAAEEPAAAAVHAEADAAAAENADLNAAQAALGAEVRGLKEQVAAAGAAAAAATAAAEAATAEAGRLRGMVVDDPEALRTGLNELVLDADRERAAADAAERRCRELGARSEAVAKVGRDVAKTAAAVDAAGGELARKKQVSAAVKDLRARVAAAEAGASELAATQARLARQAAALQDRAARAASQAALKLDAAKAVAEERALARAEVLAAGEAGAAKRAQAGAAARAAAARLADAKASATARANAAVAAFEGLKAEVAAYHARLDAAAGGGIFGQENAEPAVEV